MENNGKYDDYPFLAGRMAWNGFILVRIEAIIDMLLMRGSNRNVIMIPGIIIGSCGFNNSHYRHDNLFADVQWLSIV